MEKSKVVGMEMIILARKWLIPPLSKFGQTGQAITARSWLRRTCTATYNAIEWHADFRCAKNIYLILSDVVEIYIYANPHLSDTSLQRFKMERDADWYYVAWLRWNKAMQRILGKIHISCQLTISS